MHAFESTVQMAALNGGAGPQGEGALEDVVLDKLALEILAVECVGPRELGLRPDGVLAARAHKFAHCSI